MFSVFGCLLSYGYTVLFLKGLFHMMPDSISVYLLGLFLYLFLSSVSNKLTQRLYDTMTGMQYGKIPDDMGWIEKL